MLKIDTDTWKSFRVVDLGFSVYHGQRLNKAQRIESKTPFITAGFENRGVTQYIGNDRPIYHKAITVDMFGNCFFQSEDCADDDNVYFFVNDDVNDLVKLFISAGIGAMTFSKFDYARQFRQGDADNLEVMLPATSDGEPDWAYMEQYMRDVMNREEIFAEHLALLTAEAVVDGHVIDTSAWKAFRVGELFEVLLAKGDIQPKQCEGGETLLVSAGNEDNGVAAHISAEGDGVSELFSAHCITVSMFGRAFWQNEPFYAVSHGRVNILQPKQAVSDMTGLFLATALNAATGNDFNYQTMCTRARLVDISFMLPATPDGDPDWAYMEQYMKHVMAVESAFADELDKLVM